jgi:hypothetical protein
MGEKKQRLAVPRLAGLILLLAITLLALGGCAGALAREGAGDDSPAARGGTKRETRVRGAQPPVTPQAAVAVPAPAAIQISYRLDPWLVSGNYGKGFWASPPVLGPTVQSGSRFVVQARAEGLGGGPVTGLEWIPTDPAMVKVTPSQGPDVKIIVERAGQCTLQVRSHESTKELVIKAEYKGDALLVEIAQQP